MKITLQAVLDRVKDPEAHLSVSELALAQKIRYDKTHKKLMVFFNFIRPGSACCSLLSQMVLSVVKKRLQAELESEFPELTVELL